MRHETETRLEEWAALIGEDLSDDAESIAREQRSVWRDDGADDRRLF